uniref:Putative secreted protein n=1 Tax=Xenopsylla cheopis TaxID=163159 RepID=A0A6M2DSW4_XENCH
MMKIWKTMSLIYLMKKINYVVYNNKFLHVMIIYYIFILELIVFYNKLVHCIALRYYKSICKIYLYNRNILNYRSKYEFL